MKGKLRYIYPGNNTPRGFFSYYDYILGQMEANKIYCLKGGPGTGKSTFMKKVGQEMLDAGHDVDFMMCSSDPDSLDGIVIKDMAIAMMDGTSPHVVDPKNPGAVDSIINLGEYWNEKGIRENKQNVIKSNEKIGSFFRKAYNYLGAAGKMYDNLKDVYEKALKNEELFKFTSGIVHKELAHKELATKQGAIKKFFASAITPQGLVNQVETLVSDYQTIYLIQCPIGISGDKILKTFLENACVRGFDTECYYCPMEPDTKLEHLLIPALGIAFVTSNDFHTLDISNAQQINISDFLREDVLKENSDFIEDCKTRMKDLIEQGVSCIKAAKAEHDILEENYIPHMNFEGIEECRKKLIKTIGK